MTDHLPECIYTPEHFDPEQNIVWGGKPCICEEIKRAEKRVRDEIAADGPWFRSVVHQCCEDKQTAYAAGLDAAREAVATIPPAWEHPEHPEMQDIDKANALAVIDALKEKP